MPDLLIVGASARAAACSALRAGLAVRTCDLFADADLCRRVRADRVETYPSGFEHWMAGQADAPWLYTGALENHPALIESMGRLRPLYGVSGQSLRAVRNPFRLAAVLSRAGLRFPESSSTPPAARDRGRWLIKRRRSAGGSGIRVWNREDQPPWRPGHDYFQRRLHGQSLSAVYVGDGRRARLLGVTEQLVGTHWTGARGFQYAGSIGPADLPRDVVEAIEKVGERLAAGFGLRGLFGIDLILDDHKIWVIEVNPRYTASVEVLERMASLQAIRMHVEACRDGRLPADVTTRSTKFFGKAIVYARDEVVAGPRFVSSALEQSADRARPAFADIPHCGTRIRPGGPMVTVFAEGDALAAVRSRLRAKVEAVEEALSREA